MIIASNAEARHQYWVLSRIGIKFKSVDGAKQLYWVNKMITLDCVTYTLSCVDSIRFQ